MSIETFEKQEQDAEMIWNQIISCEFDTFEEVQSAVTDIYITDLSISRTGISRALEMLKEHFDEKTFYRNEVK